MLSLFKDTNYYNFFKPIVKKGGAKKKERKKERSFLG